MIENYGTYRFALAGNLYLHPFFALRMPCEIRTHKNRSPLGADEFMLIQAGGSSYYIASVRSGLLLTIRPAMRPAQDQFPGIGGLWQMAYDPERDMDFRFFVEPASEKDEYRLSACDNDYSIGAMKIEHNQQLLAIDPQVAEELEPSLSTFLIKAVDDAPRPDLDFDGGMQLEWFETARPSAPPPHVASIDARIPSAAPPELVQHSIVPFFRVRDPWYDVNEQVRKSPLYRFTHRTVWCLVRDRTLDGPIERVERERTAVGMSASAAKSFGYTFKTEKTSGWSVGAEAGVEAGAKGVKGDVGGSFSYSKSKSETRALDLAYESAVEAQREREVTKTLTYKEHECRYRLLTWRIVDIFELRRSDHDESLVNAWKSIREDDEFIDKVIDHLVEGDEDAAGGHGEKHTRSKGA